MTTTATRENTRCCFDNTSHTHHQHTVPGRSSPGGKKPCGERASETVTHSFSPPIGRLNVVASFSGGRLCASLENVREYHRQTCEHCERIRTYNIVTNSSGDATTKRQGLFLLCPKTKECLCILFTRLESEKFD